MTQRISSDPDDKAELYAIRRVLDDHQAVCSALNATERHLLAETLAKAALWEVNRRGEATRCLVFDSNGNPICTCTAPLASA